MDAYTSYMLDVANARLRDLRQDAAERALSKAARAGRQPLWRRALAYCGGRRAGGTETVMPVGLPARLPEPDFDLFA